MQPTVLLLGYGNPGRQDDRLGPACADTVEIMGIQGVTVDQNYQLTVEDSVAIVAHDVVVFVDADAVGPAPFSFRRVEPKPGLPFSSHGIEPDALVALANGLSGRSTEAWLLGIRGYAFDELREEITPQARQNLDEALAFLEPVLRNRSFRSAVGTDPRPAADRGASDEGGR